MKLKSTLLLGSFLATIVGLNSCNSCNNNSDNSDININKKDQNSIDTFDTIYFAKYNDTFIANTDDENFKVSELAFHTWAWQKYLHLTQNRREKDTLKHELPLFLDDDNIYQITPNGERFYGINDNDTLWYRQSELVLSAFHQAGSDHPVLTSNQDFGDKANDYTVFYSIHMNDIMYDQMVKAADSAITKINLSKALQKQNISDSTEEYVNGSLELKAAWIDAKAVNNDSTKYLIIKNVKQLNNSVVEKIDKELREKESSIKNLKKEIVSLEGEAEKKKLAELNNLIDNPIYTPIETDYDNVDVALIGLHIVGKVKGFPELLWATFEGQDLAPDNLHNLTDDNSKKRHKAKTHSSVYDSNVVNSDQDFLFHKKNNLALYGAEDAIKFNPDSSKGEIVDKIFRRYPLGVSTDALLNKGFYTHAILENALNTAALKNNEIKLYYNGNIWLGKLDVKSDEKDYNRTTDVFNQFKQKSLQLAGSPNATNITMETFKQSTQCFNCHTTANSYQGKYILKEGKLVPEIEIEYNSLLNVSHIYTAYFKNKAGRNLYPKATSTELKAISEYIKTLNEQKLEATFN